MRKTDQGRCARWCLLLASFLGGGAGLRSEEKADQAPATIEVDGLGWWDNREQRNTLKRLLGEERRPVLEANAIEDAAFLLMSGLIEEGYLQPTIRAELQRVDQPPLEFVFDWKLESTLPRPLEARRVRFTVATGVRYRFEDVVLSGLRAIPEEAAREYFIGEKVLIRPGAVRAYSPTRLRRSIEGLASELRRRGYADATVATRRLEVNDTTGAVRLEIEVNEGARWTVGNLDLALTDEQNVDLPQLREFLGQPWSQFLQQDIVEMIRRDFFRRGYPDVRVRVRAAAADEVAGERNVAVTARVNPGESVKVGAVRFEGAERTQEEVLRRRVRTQPGDVLNPLALEQARFRLGRLGVFESVDLRYDPTTGTERDPVFTLREGREIEANLLLGYGSYEQLRGGVEMRQFNLFGRAHQSRLLLVQSMKSSRGEYTYTVPELFGESLDGTARVFGLQREETSFLRQEYGGNVAVSSPVKWLGANATLGYTFQSLQNRDNELDTRGQDDRQVNAASVDLNLVRDRRDNPLRPRDGYRWFLQLETASRFLGGGVDYQRIELGGSYHTAWGRGRWVHLGLNHGLVTTWGADDRNLPVNKRFYPGGDNSIRGYQAGEAAPVGADGRFVGAKSYLLANVELEQALTPKWSVVLFGDALGSTVRLADYPFDETLYSIGLGLRYHTLIGPLRVEYARNLNPRAIDPGGTLLLSVGFPF